MTDLYHFNTRTSFNMKTVSSFYAIVGILSFVVTTFAAWVTHVVVCIKTASWILLVFGIVVPPIGLVHGFGTWFGWFA